MMISYFPGKGIRLEKFRGTLLILVAFFALYKGWIFHTGPQAILAYVLGALALAVGIYRLVRKSALPRR
jgi:high-affinity Fe2+/Pb2+ permease